MNKKKYVVTIARQFGSMGRPIAMKLSEILGLNSMIETLWIKRLKN